MFDIISWILEPVFGGILCQEGQQIDDLNLAFLLYLHL